MPEPAVGGEPTAVGPAELESHGVLLVLDGDRRVAHASEHCEALLGSPAAALIGQALERAAGADADRVLRAVLDEGIERAGGWWPAALPTGEQIKLRAFPVARGLVGLDLLPAAGEDHVPGDANSMERVAGWNDWLLSCSSSDELLRVVASVARERLGFHAAFVHRIDGEGRSVVVAADGRGADRFVGQTLLPEDAPPAQPRVHGRAVPFFVADLHAPGNRLVPGEPGLDLDPSALLRPYPEYLARFASFGVGAVASLPLVLDGRLWGRLVATNRVARRVPAATQSELRLLAAAASEQLAELIGQEDAREQVELARFSLRLMGSVAAAPDLVDGLTRSPVDLSGVCAAEGAIVAIGGRVECSGSATDLADPGGILVAARHALGSDAETAMVAVETLAETGLDPQLAAGYLAVRLGQDAEDVVVWIRPASERAVTFIEPEVVDGPLGDGEFTRVTEREEASDRSCAPWTAAQRAQADELRQAIGQVLVAQYGKVRALNDELQRSNEEYDAFAHAAAHDLKAPLRAIRYALEFHLEDTQDRLSEAEQEELHGVGRQVDRMNALLDDLMAYAQVGNETWEPRPVALPEAVAEVTELLGPVAGDCDLVVEPGSFTTDPAGLRQLLLNLVGNAVKYSEGAPRVEISTTTLGEAASRSVVPTTLAAANRDAQVLVVADDGIGIDPAHHDAVFNLFRQLDAAADGTGTGLALCRLICRRRGGDIWLASTPGEGTTFFVAPG